jgi:hypothetical protein
MSSLLMTAVRGPEVPGRYVVLSPDGARIEVPKELFLALSDFISARKEAGSMTVHFRNGGVAGLETLVKKRYK